MPSVAFDRDFLLTVKPFKLNVIHNSEIKPSNIPLMTVEKLHLTFGAAWL